MVGRARRFIISLYIRVKVKSRGYLSLWVPVGFIGSALTSVKVCCEPEVAEGTNHDGLLESIARASLITRNVLRWRVVSLYLRHALRSCFLRQLIASTAFPITHDGQRRPHLAGCLGLCEGHSRLNAF